MIASHIPGGENVSADRGSREFTDMSEWKLDPIIIQPFRLNCQTDLSASRLTSQLADYEFLVSKETVVLRRWERSKQKFGFVKRVDKG